MMIMRRTGGSRKAAARIGLAGLLALVAPMTAAADGHIVRLGPGAALLIDHCGDDGRFQNVTLIDAGRETTPLIVVGAAAEIVPENGGALRLWDAVVYEPAPGGAQAHAVDMIEVSLDGVAEASAVARFGCAGPDDTAAPPASGRDSRRPGSANAPIRQPERRPSQRLAVCAAAADASDVFTISAQPNGAVDAYFARRALALDIGPDGVVLTGDGAFIAISADSIAAAETDGDGRLVLELAAPAGPESGLYVVGLRCGG